MFERLSVPPVDSLMEISQLYRADHRTETLDLGIGTYRNADGEVPIMEAVHLAEQRLAMDGAGKAYKGPRGDRLFAELLIDLHFPNLASERERRFMTIQAPGGTGALRLALELVSRASRDASILVGAPTWPAHIPMVGAVGLHLRSYRHVDPSTGQPDIASLLLAIDRLRPGDAVILHGCCHNPTGAFFSASHWRIIAAALEKRQILPIVDLAYAGMAEGVEIDVQGARLMLDALPEAMVAISCSKSFGLYRERAGLLGVMAANTPERDRLDGTAQAIARLLWSNPPDHGAAVVRTILEDTELRFLWRKELGTMRRRIAGIRSALGATTIPGLDLSQLVDQQGLFALLPLPAASIIALRERHGIYMEGAGRINLAGLNAHNFERFVEALGQIKRARPMDGNMPIAMA